MSGVPSANTSSRKSFTQRDYVRSSTDDTDVGTDLYSQQDTRMYHYPYAWEAFAHVRALTHARIFSNWKGKFRYTRGVSCPEPGIDLGLSNRYVELSSASSSLLVDTLVLWSFAILRAVSRPMTLQSYGQQCALPSPTRYSFFPLFARSWITRQALGLPCGAAKRNKLREPSDIFIPMLGNPLH